MGYENGKKKVFANETALSPRYSGNYPRDIPGIIYAIFRGFSHVLYLKMDAGERTAECDVAYEVFNVPAAYSNSGTSEKLYLPQVGVPVRCYTKFLESYRFMLQLDGTWQSDIPDISSMRFLVEPLEDQWLIILYVTKLGK